MAVITGAIIGGAMSLAGGIFGGRAARRQARAAKSRMRKLNSKLNSLEANRQDIINPYADVTSTADMLSNPFTQLSVSTAAMDMQIEQTDQALANTLDTLRQTGGGAGSATALAQAALQSKKDVAADIERQEVQNDKARIQGEANLQKDLIAEAQRMQSVDVQGKQFVYSETEKREQQQLDRVSNQIAAQQQNLATAQANQSAATSGMFNALGGIATSAFGS
jgi:chromosome segregation ATPase